MALVLLLGLAQGAQLGVPVGFERISDESVLGVHVHVAMAGVVGFELGPLDVPMAQAVSLFETRLNLLLHGEGQLDGHGRHGLDEQLADGSVDLGPDDALTYGVAVAAATAEAHGRCVCPAQRHSSLPVARS